MSETVQRSSQDQQVEEVIAYVYGLQCPIDSKIHYVGLTNRPYVRFKGHLSEGHAHNDFRYKYGAWHNPSQRREAWLAALLWEGIEPILVVLQELPGVDSRDRNYKAPGKAAEREWIQRLYREGHPLTNVHGLTPDPDEEEERVLQEAIRRGKELFGT